MKGSLSMRSSGNPIIIQNRESCVVFGMPGAIFEAAAYDSIQNLEEISATIGALVQFHPHNKMRAG